jgi:DNA polymerase-1
MIVTFDLETTNLSKGSALDPQNRVLMVSWCEDTGPVRTFVGPLMEAGRFWDAYNRADAVCCHHAKFEMHWVARVGADIDKKKWHDTMLAERVLQGNRQLPLGLGDVSARYGFQTKDPVIDSLMKAGVCPSDMPQKRLKARCVRDVRTTAQILQKQLEKLTEQEQLHIYRTRVEFARVLCHMEREGMLLDKDRVYEQYDAYSRGAAVLKEKLDKITGGINLRSTDQLAEFLYDTLGFEEKKDGRGKPIRNKPSKRWPDGKPMTDKATLTWLEARAKTDEQREFIQVRQAYGKANAALTKNLEFFKGVVDERNGRFIAQFNQTVAATHRLSSSGLPIQFRQFDKPKSVQLQNMPREFKRLFVAPPDWCIVEVDAAQLEFRVAAYCGQDEQAKADIADPDFDAHCKSASVMNERVYSSFLDAYRSGDPAYKAMRQDAKADTFKPLYGGTRGTEAQERWYREFQSRYSSLYSAQESWVAEVARTGELRLPWGMRFYWDGKYNKRGVLIDKKTFRPLGPQIFNYPVQSLATAEMMPIAITALYDAAKRAKLRVRFVNTIHDSVICYVHGKDLDKFHKLCKEAFTTAVREHLQMFYGIDFNVPLGCGFTPGTHWGEGEEIIHDEVQES